MDEQKKHKFQKVHRTDKIWWVHTEGCIGELKISFDKKTIINLWTDYHRLSPEQKEMFECDRCKGEAALISGVLAYGGPYPAQGLRGETKV